MKKTIALLAVSALYALGSAVAAPLPQGGASQQNGQAFGQRRADPQRRIEMLANRLNLTADQQKQLLPVLTNQQQQMSAILHDSSLSREDRMAKIKSVREAANAKITAMLTDTQKTAWQQMQQERRERFHARRGPQNAAPGGNSSNL